MVGSWIKLFFNSMADDFRKEWEFVMIFLAFKVKFFLVKYYDRQCYNLNNFNENLTNEDLIFV